MVVTLGVSYLRVDLCMYGSFSEASLEVLRSIYDFTRCKRPDGSIYGSRGKCRKGTETVAEGETEKTPKAKKPRLSKNEKIALDVMADKSLRSDRKRIAEMVRRGVPADTNFISLVGEARRKIGLDKNVTVWDPKKKSLAERMAAAAERLEREKTVPATSAPKAANKEKKKPEPQPKEQEAQTAAAKTARPVDPKVAAKVDKAVAAKAKGPSYTPEQLAAQDRLLAQSQSKAKKPKETPEVKAEKKWLAQEEKVKAIQAEHDKIKAELEGKGIKVYVTGKGANTMLRVLKERGIPTQAQLTRMQIKLRETQPERLKQERIAAERERIAAEIAGTSREKRKEMILKELERLKGDKYTRTLKDVDNNVEMMQKWINEDPSMATLKNRVALTAMRALRAQMVREARVRREAKNKSLDASLKEAPKYDSTPGSRKPANAKQLLGDYAAYLKKEKELDSRRKEIENSGRLTDLKVQKEYYSLLEEISAHSKGRIPGNPVSLDKIYEVQGFNAKPELVRGRSDLESRKDILREPDGRPLILYRGVTEEGYARQFQGSGPDGGKHFPGQGVYGNGTYAASAGGNVRESRWITDGNYDQTAQRTAISYAAGGQDAGNKVTAFALRKDANVVQFEGETTSQRDNKYYEWRREITRQAKEKFGIDFNDHGEAAAAMGIHAYRVPMNDSEDYWVILNRGAVIAAQDPQLPDQ